MNEQITLTKEDLLRIVQEEVNKRLSPTKEVKPGQIFVDVKIEDDNFEFINSQYECTDGATKLYRGAQGLPLSLKRYAHGFESLNYKVHTDRIHDHLRGLTLSIFGVTLNRDLERSEYEQAAKFYEELKEVYLGLYERRLSTLSKEDFK